MGNLNFLKIHMSFYANFKPHVKTYDIGLPSKIVEVWTLNDHHRCFKINSNILKQHIAMWICRSFFTVNSYDESYLINIQQDMIMKHPSLGCVTQGQGHKAVTVNVTRKDFVLGICISTIDTLACIK